MISPHLKIGIIGGGPAGVATAIRLKQHNFSVVLFEASTPDQITIGEHLAAEALHEFKKLEIPETILTKHSIPCSEVQNAWGKENIHYNESIFNPFGDGYILSRPNFDNALLNYLQELGIDIRFQTRISKVSRTENGWKLTSNSDDVDVHFLVDASGRTSKFNFGNKVPRKPTENSLVGITKHLFPTQKTPVKKSHLLVESTSKGWWYTVQIASGAIVSTFMTDPKILSNAGISHSLFWDQQLSDSTHTQKRLRDVKLPTSVFIQSAHSHIAPQIYGDYWLKVGDAAQSFDPLSSAGIIKGLKTGQLAADAIYGFLSDNITALERYKEEIQRQYKEYIEKRDEYYRQEKRWIDSSFWYKRIFSIHQISNFSITPLNALKVIDTNPTEKILFLNSQLPEIDFSLLVNSIKKFPVVKDAMNHYLKHQQSKINPWFLHALESLKILKIIG